MTAKNKPGKSSRNAAKAGVVGLWGVEYYDGQVRAEKNWKRADTEKIKNEMINGAVAVVRVEVRR